MISLAAALVLASSANELPAFTFREHSSTRTYDEAALNKAAGCRKAEDGRICVLDTTVGGWRMDLIYTVARQKLTSLSIHGHRNAIPDTLMAFKERYGAPCRSGKEAVQNRIGNSFESTTFTWCFRTGELVFHERGHQIDRFSAIYTDRANTPSRERIAPDF